MRCSKPKQLQNGDLFQQHDFLMGDNCFVKRNSDDAV